MADADRFIEIFNEAKARAIGAERDGFLAESCGDDAELKAQVLSLLGAHEEAGEFLKAQPALSPEIEAELARLKPEEIGERIGPYKLREQIGEGGFGAVWVAEQQEPVRRTVALKIIKMGMDTREVVARFEQERQALAMMDHPNIARVLDAGATEHGRPFFVMELVRGIKITDYCDQANLPTAERLALFIQVCHAVQHAHQKGIIHRDLKPSNILVTLHDGVPVPKVIDFGVAKATQGRLAENTVYTQFQQMIGTPLYMSPEQAEMSGLDVDTRTDIYALGVLLYELLTGRTPFDADALKKAGYDEMRRIIREQEPQKPSTALDTMAKATLTTVAHHRSSEPPKLIHAIRGDLDWIVMKTLEKDRSRRYDTANGLAMDIQRHLENEPVLARPPSQFYRLGRLIRRNRVVFAATAAVTAALVIGLSLALQSFFNERRARANEAEQRKIAEERGREATASELLARRFLYAADMNLAQEALRVNNLGRARRLLDQHREGKPDLRGWEWRYLWQQCRSGAIATLTKHTERVDSVSFSADNKLLAIAFGDGRLELWDVTTRKLVSAFNSDDRGQVRFAPRGSVLAQNVRAGVKLYDFATNEEPVIVELAGHIRAFSYSQSGSKLICFSQPRNVTFTGPSQWQNARVTFVDVARREIAALEKPGSFKAYQPAGDVRLSPDGARLFISSQLSRALTVAVYNQQNGAFEHEFMVGTDDTLSAMDVSPDGKILVTGTGYENSVIRVWDAVTYKLIAQLDRHTAWIPDLSFSPDGRTLASASGDQTVRLWDTQTWLERAVLRGHGGEVRTVAFSPDGKLLASGAKDGEVLLWSSEAFPAFDSRVAFPDNGWRPAMGKKSSPDGKLMASPSETGVVKLLNLETASEMTLQGHLLAVDGVAFTPDSNRLATTSGGREAAKLWDTTTGQELLNLPGQGMNLYYADFSEDGDVLVAGSPTAGFWQHWRAPSWTAIEAAERTGGMWPQTETLASPALLPTPDGLKNLLGRGARDIPAAARSIPWIGRLHRAGVEFELLYGQRGIQQEILGVRITSKEFADLALLEGAQFEWLDLKDTQVADLSPLKGMSLRKLWLGGTRVASLTPVAGMPLTEAWVAETKVTDLSPLRGMPLRTLDLRDTLVADLSTLRGLPLRQLYIQGTKVSDLSPLADLPLSEIYLDGTPATDLTPLAKIGTLKKLILPNRVADLAALRKLSHLDRLSYAYDEGINGPSMSTTEFWADNDAREAARPLEKGDYAQATAALKSLIENTRKTPGSDSKSTVAATGQLAKCYVWQGQLSAAVPYFRDVIASHRNREENHRDADDWVRLAATLAAAGNAAEYRATCLDMARIFGGTGDKFVAERLVKACSIAPNSGIGEIELREFMRLAKPMQDGKFQQWYFASAALAQYRTGQTSAAADFANKVSEKGIAPTTVANALLAMIRQYEGRPDEARSMLAQARLQIDAHWPPRNDDDGGPWHEWLIARILVLEAEQMIAPPKAR